jgi:hypothetical protein
MDNCEDVNLCYPIRTLSEIFNCDNTELTLSKRLNSRTLYDFKIAQFTKKEQVLFSKADQFLSGQFKSAGTNVNTLIDIKANLESAVKKLEKSRHLDTLVLCLKIVSKMRVHFSDLADLHFTLLDKIGSLIQEPHNREKMVDKDREVFYDEVKCFISTIKSKESKIDDLDEAKWNMLFK